MPSGLTKTNIVSQDAVRVFKLGFEEFLVRLFEDAGSAARNLANRVTVNGKDLGVARSRGSLGGRLSDAFDEQRSRAAHADPPSDAIAHMSDKSLAEFKSAAGVRRMARSCYPEVRWAARQFLFSAMTAAVAFAECARRVTISGADACLALEQQGRAFYGELA